MRVHSPVVRGLVLRGKGKGVFQGKFEYRLKGLTRGGSDIPFCPLAVRKRSDTIRAESRAHLCGRSPNSGDIDKAKDTFRKELNSVLQALARLCPPGGRGGRSTLVKMVGGTLSLGKTGCGGTAGKNGDLYIGRI